MDSIEGSGANTSFVLAATLTPDSLPYPVVPMLFVLRDSSAVIDPTTSHLRLPLNMNWNTGKLFSAPTVTTGDFYAAGFKSGERAYVTMYLGIGYGSGSPSLLYYDPVRDQYVYPATSVEHSNVVGITVP